jgi:hypothetical protein
VLVSSLSCTYFFKVIFNQRFHTYWDKTNMKISTLVALLAVAACSAANAASLSYTQNGNSYAIFLAGEEDNGMFDTVDVVITPEVGTTFANNDPGFEGFAPRPAGQQFTYINQFLGAASAQGGEGWSVLGAVNTPTSVAFAGGPLGQTISTAAKPDGRLFLANVIYSPTNGASTANVQLISAGIPIETLSLRVPIPEPATLAMAGLGLIGMVVVSRRKA